MIMRMQVVFWSVWLLLIASANGESKPSEVTVDSALTVYYFQRNRERLNAESDQFETNLHHSTLLGDWSLDIGASENVRLRLGIYGAYDLSVVEGDKVHQENEFSFAAERWGDNYEEGDDNSAANGLSYRQAAIAWQIHPSFLLTLGYDQHRLAGLIGTNWSFLPGTSRGLSAAFSRGHYRFAYVWIDRYKAPWFSDVQTFSTENAWADPFQNDSEIPYLHGISLSMQHWGVAMDMSVAASIGYMHSHFYKIARAFGEDDGYSFSYQLYRSDTKSEWDDKANGYRGVAWLQGVTFQANHEKYRFNIEGTAVQAKGKMGNYLPRLTRGYGNSQGALEIWWDLRSDWNHHNEKALFVAVTRSLADWIGQPGWSVRVAGAYGWDAEYRPAGLRNGKESAFGLDLTYQGNIGRFTGVKVQWHYVDYHNHQDRLGSWAFPNMFTSERDVQLRVVIPF